MRALTDMLDIRISRSERVSERETRSADADQITMYMP